MADIKVGWSAAFQAGESMKACKKSVDAVVDTVSKIQKSPVFYSDGLSQYKSIIQNVNRQIQEESEGLGRLRDNLDAVIALYKETEQNLSGRKQTPAGKKNGRTKHKSKGKSIYKPDVAELVFKGIGEAGVIGGAISCIHKLINAGWKDDKILAGLKSTKELAKMAGKVAGVVNAGSIKAEWNKLLSKPEAYTTGYFWGKGAKTAEKVKVCTKWIGTAINAGIFGYENYQQVKEGKITADEAVISTAASTLADVGVDMAVGVAVTPIAATVGAPALVAGVVSVGVTWGLNEFCKSVTGDDIAHTVGKAAISVKREIEKSETVKAVGNKIMDSAEQIAQSAKSMGRKIFSPWMKNVPQVSYV